MKPETFLIVGVSTILTMALFLGGKDKSRAQRLFTSTNKEYKFISIEIKNYEINQPKLSR